MLRYVIESDLFFLYSSLSDVRFSVCALCRECVDVVASQRTVVVCHLLLCAVVFTSRTLYLFNAILLRATTKIADFWAYFFPLADIRYIFGKNNHGIDILHYRGGIASFSTCRRAFFAQIRLQAYRPSKHRERIHCSMEILHNFHSKVLRKSDTHLTWRQNHFLEFHPGWLLLIDRISTNSMATITTNLQQNKLIFSSFRRLISWDFIFWVSE